MLLCPWLSRLPVLARDERKKSIAEDKHIRTVFVIRQHNIHTSFPYDKVVPLSGLSILPEPICPGKGPATKSQQDHVDGTSLSSVYITSLNALHQPIIIHLYDQDRRVNVNKEEDLPTHLHGGFFQTGTVNDKWRGFGGRKDRFFWFPITMAVFPGIIFYELGHAIIFRYRFSGTNLLCDIFLKKYMAMTV